MKQLEKNILFIEKSLLLLLFTGYSVSTIMFYHTHLVNGIMVTHSHPYKLPDKKGPVKNHSHSNSEYIFLQHLCETLITDSIFNPPFIPDRPDAFCVDTILSYNFFLSSTYTTRKFPRSPPVC